MPLQTRITKLLGIQHPIIMGGMTGVGTPELAAAVSNAGGLGLIAIHNAGTPENGREWIRKLRTMTTKPFGVNLTILPTMGTPPPYDEYTRVIIEEGVKIVETAGSSPKKYGVDIISLDGFECAGHPGEEDIGNYVLQAKGAKVLSRPFVCSGGVGDGKQIAAALALGADGVNCGTRFCATTECNWPDSFKKKMLEANETDTVLMLRRLKNTARVFRNKVATEVEEIESKMGDAFLFPDVAHLVMGTRGREAERNNDADGGIWTAGQVVGLIDSIPSCQELMDQMMKEAEDTILGRLNALVVPKSSL